MSLRRRLKEKPYRPEAFLSWLLFILLIALLAGESKDKLSLPVSLNDWQTCPTHWNEGDIQPLNVDASNNPLSLGEEIQLAYYHPESGWPTTRSQTHKNFLEAFHADRFQEVPIFHAVNSRFLLNQLLAYPCEVVADFDLLTANGETTIRHSPDDPANLDLNELLSIVQANSQLKGIHFDPKDQDSLADVLTKVNQLTDRYVFINYSLAGGPGGGRVADEKTQDFLNLMLQAREQRNPQNPPLVLMATWQTRQVEWGSYELAQMIEILRVLDKYEGPVMFAVDAGYFQKNPEIIDTLLELAWGRGVDAWGIKLYSLRDLREKEFVQIESLIAQSNNLQDRVMYELTVRR